nr:BREX-1 system adenine-specific DNA-methyltransferase PglX [Endozoicomonas sp. ONNA2]
MIGTIVRPILSPWIQPNICILQNVDLRPEELQDYMDFVGRDLFTMDLQTTLCQFEEADNFGSLIRPALTDVAGIGDIIKARDLENQVLLGEIHKKVQVALKQADYLSPKYHVVVANPPYMGSKGMNPTLKKFASDEFPNSKSDLFAMFIERCLMLVQKQGLVGMITMQSWMFLSSFEKLRASLLGCNTFTTMVHLGARAFDSIGGEVVATTAFTLVRTLNEKLKGTYIRLTDTDSELAKSNGILESVSSNQNMYFASTSDFRKISGTPIAYWLSKNVGNIFSSTPSISANYSVNPGIRSGQDELFLRLWYEVSHNNIQLHLSSATKMKPHNKWFPMHKGGTYRKWYGNAQHVIDLFNNGQNIKEKSPDFRLRDSKFYFKPFVSWSRIGTTDISFRYFASGVLFSDAGPGIFANDDCLNVIALLNSKLGTYFLKIINPTMNYQKQDIETVPYKKIEAKDLVKKAVELARKDWDSAETSWDFSACPLLPDQNSYPEKLACTYRKVRQDWMNAVTSMLEIEESNNNLCITKFGLEGEFSGKVETQDISLVCNPYYRYGMDKSEEKLEKLLLADTIREFISYAIGCMFGRYSLDKPGLILANQGDTLEEYLQQIPQPGFMPDADNVIPILEESWFTDDIVDRFRDFLKITFGEEHFEENLSFIENAIGKDIRKFFIKDFYNDHVKRYKKRPIYWLFSSPKGYFNALIYLHRYRPDTASVVLNKYLREFVTKLNDEKKRHEQISIDPNASGPEKSKALKQIDRLDKMLEDIEEYEHDTLFPLATGQLPIDLDDGVKINYNLLGKALKKVPGLTGK